MSTVPSGAADFPPRHFWRRLVAVAIDALLLALAVLPLAWAVQSATGLPTTTYSVYQSTACEPRTEPPAALIEALAVGADEQATYSFCTVTQMGLVDSYSWTASARSGAVTRSIVVPAAADGSVEGFAAVPFGELVYVAVPFVSALFYALYGRTPGKALAGLRLVDTQGRTYGARLPYGRALIRTLGSMLPYWYIALLGLLAVAFAPSAGLDLVGTLTGGEWSGFSILAIIGFAVALVWFVLYAWTFVAWNGAMFYDRWARAAIVRT